MHLLRRLFLLALALLLGIFVYLFVAYSVALDRDFRHSSAVEQLPDFNGEDGLVLLAARGHHFRARVAGYQANPDGPVVMLLHGFPVTSAMWLPVVEPLVAAGYRVLAPDQRGYSPGARPATVEAYALRELIADVLAMADAAGINRFHLVGHDWGAIVGWHVATDAPDRVISWSALSIPHPSAFANAIETNSEQRRRSRYVRFFALPLLPEVLLARDDYRRLKALGLPQWPEQADEYVSTFSEPGAATAAMNWYRALLPGFPQSMRTENRLAVPTLFIWGKHDPILDEGVMETQRPFVEGIDYKTLELDAGHRLLLNHSEPVAAALIAHLGDNT